MRTILFTLLLSTLLATCRFAIASDKEGSQLRVATFCCEVTPPLGSPLRHKPLETVEDSLLAKGIVLDDGHSRYILCSVDWCLTNYSTHLFLRRKMAQAAGTDDSRVALHCVHQHTAPWGDEDVQRLIDQTANPFVHSDMKFNDEVADRLAASVKKATGELEPFDQIGVGEAKVYRVASSRRIITQDGKFHGRMSGTKDPELKALPEGKIDPMLKTITLARGDTPIARLHYYATHPQSFYGDPRACSDVPGFAREKLQDKENVFQIYFTGCAGDVAMGKYNDRSRHARTELTERLLAGMEAAIAATRMVRVDRLQWRCVPLRLPPRTDRGYTVKENREKLADSRLSKMARAQAARRVAYAERSEQPIDLTCLVIGPANVLHLPGEPMIEFQLYAQRLLPNALVAVAENGDWSPGYICTEEAFAEGGYEPSGSNVAPHSETILKAAIRSALGVDSVQDNP
jgi:hypothetical protein